MLCGDNSAKSAATPQIESRSNVSKDENLARKTDNAERALRLLALKAERRECYRIERTGMLPEEIVRKLVPEVDLLETRFKTT